MHIQFLSIFSCYFMFKYTHSRECDNQGFQRDDNQIRLNTRISKRHEAFSKMDINRVFKYTHSVECDIQQMPICITDDSLNTRAPQSATIMLHRSKTATRLNTRTPQSATCINLYTFVYKGSLNTRTPQSATHTTNIDDELTKEFKYTHSVECDYI